MSDLLQSKQQNKIDKETQEQFTTLADELKKDYRFPMDFVQYIERDYIPKQFIPKSDKLFKINRPNDLKFNVLDFKPKTQLNQKLFRHDEPKITAIAGYGEYIYIGNKKGVVKKYSCKSETESTVFIDSTIDAITYSPSVECIDISQNGNYIAIGYSNGFLSLWEMKGFIAKLIKLVDKAHRIGIVAVKFASTSRLNYELLTSDMEGNVLHLKISEGFLVNTYVTSLIYRENSPTFLIDVFTPTEQQKALYPFCRTNTVLVLFGCIEKVNLYSLSPELKKLYVFNNPAHKGVKQIPNASFGIGCEPTPRDSKGKVIKSQLSHNRHCVMLAISWDDTLIIYKLLLDTLIIEEGNLCGFLNNSQILRMGFLDTSLIYFFDGMKKIKLLNTNLMNGKFEERGTKRDYDTIPLLDEGDEIFEDIQCKNEIIDHSDKTNKPKATYNSFLMSSNTTIFFITSKSIHLSNLLNWEDSIKTLKEKAQWEKALLLGLDIYDGNISSLANIPQDEAERKRQSSSKVKELLEQYTNATLSKVRGGGGGGGGGLLLKEEGNDKVSECINMNIEICIQIDQVAFLFCALLEIFEKKELKNTFITLLEPFILLNRFKKLHFPNDTIDMFYQFYSKENQYPVLTQLLIKLNFEFINTDKVYKLCEDNFLFSLLIYLDCHNRKYFHPIEEMHSQYPSLNEIDNKPFFAYNYYLKKYKLYDLLKSKTYVRHKTLWYCYFCLTGTVCLEYPHITQDEYEELIICILNFLLKPSVFKDMIEFDSYSFFKVLSRFFIEQTLVVIVSKDINKQRITLDLTCAGCSSNDPLLEQIFSYIIKSTERMQSLLIKQDLNEFIALRSSNKTIDLATMIKSGTFLIDFYNEINKHTSEAIEDKYNCHGIITANYCYLKEISDILIIILDFLNEETLKAFATLSQSSSSYVLVKIKILQKQSNHIGCLNELVNNKDNPLLSKSAIFEWINQTFIKLSTNQQDSEQFEKFKKGFLDHLLSLAVFSLDDAIKITDKWFKNDQNEVIEKLKENEDIQFVILERTLQGINEDSIMTESEKVKNDYFELLILQIKLLIHFNKKNEVLPNITKRRLYPLRNVLALCKEANIKDASIHIYIALGEDMNALNLSIQDFELAFDSLIKASLDKSMTRKAYVDLLDAFIKEKQNCIDICHKSSNTSTKEKYELLWFTLLQKMYAFLREVIELPSSDNATELSLIMPKDIEELLKKMCDYIPIQDIIDKVTIDYQDAEYGQFKELLSKIMLKLIQMTSMLHSAKDLLSHSILYNLIEFKKINAKGNTFLLEKCDSCRQRFIYGDMVIAYRCGHKVHNVIPCFIEENNELICRICRMNEIDTFKPKEHGGVSMIVPKSKDKSIEDTVNSGQQSKNRENMLAKLQNFDKGFFEKSDLAAGEDMLFF